MKTLLVTGFGAFPGAPSNPSAEIVRRLERDWRPTFRRAGVRLATAILPVVYGIAPQLDALVAREKPDAIVHLGLAGRRRRLCVEMRAANVASTVKPDSRGKFLHRRALAAGGAPFRRSAWNARRTVAALRLQGVDTTLSIDAGDYVCNATLWRSLGASGTPAIFIHVPGKRRIAPVRIASALARTLPAATSRLLRDASPKDEDA